VQRYNNLHQHAAPAARICKGSSHHKTNHLNIDDMDSESDDNSNDLMDPNRPWLDEWNTYFNMNEVVPVGMGIVRWWGVYLSVFPFKTLSSLTL
jgi:hypothetical protein